MKNTNKHIKDFFLMIFEKATQEMLDQTSTKGPLPKWPLTHMNVGDVVYINQGQFGPTNPMVYAHTFGNYKGWKFSARKQPDGSFRIIRLS